MGPLSVRPSAGFAPPFEIAASYGVDLGPKPFFDVCRTASEYQSFRVVTNQSGQVVHHRVGRTDQDETTERSELAPRTAGAAASQLSSVLRRSGYLADRHLDDARSHRLAGV